VEAKERGWIHDKLGRTPILCEEIKDEGAQNVRMNSWERGKTQSANGSEAELQGPLNRSAKVKTILLLFLLF
jgi:hypothetical protein